MSLEAARSTANPAATPAEKPADEKPNFLAPPGVDNQPTCRLCEAMYSDGKLRRSILTAYLGRSVSAWPPNYGLDTTAVLRHAWQAQRWERARNLLLSAILVGVLAVYATRWTARGEARSAAIVAAVILTLAGLRGVLRWRGVTARASFVWFWKWRRGSRVLAKRILLLLVLCTALFGWLVVRLAHRTDASVTLAAAAAIVIIGVVDTYVVTGRARRCRRRYRTTDGPLLRDDVPAMPKRHELRLHELGEGPDPDQSFPGASARVVVYDLLLRNDNSFIGSGQSIGDAEYRIDTRLGRADPDGKRRRPKPVDRLELHHKVECAMRKAAVPGLWCGYRLYVDGEGAPALDVLPDPLRVPVTRQPQDEVLQFLTRTLPKRRTNLCVQVPVTGWDNEIIVTLFIRGQLIGRQLVIHSKILLLPMMRLNTDVGLKPGDRWTQAMYALWFGTTRIWAVTVASPGALVRDAFVTMRRRWRRGRIRRAVKHGQDVHYGAIDSIREQLAVGGAMVTPNALDDVKSTVAFLEQTLAKGIKAYLTERRIDTASFEGMVQNVFNQQQNKIDNLMANNVTFGNKSRAGDANKRGSDGKGAAEQNRN